MATTTSIPPRNTSERLDALFVQYEKLPRAVRLMKARTLREQAAVLPSSTATRLIRLAKALENLT